MGKWVHRLQDIDKDDKTAYCMGCQSVVSLKWDGVNQRYRCRPAWLDKERKRTGGKPRQPRKEKIKFQQGYTVYMAYQDDTLLYVGITNDIARRFRRHKDESVWWTAHNRMELTQAESKEDAEIKEKETIKNDRPLFNLRHNT